MLNPKITVITSAYNSENFVAITLESVLNQTFKDFEYIIFEDASSDNTAKILKEYSQKDSRIKIVTKEKNLGYQGFIKNLNSGLKMARGKYIARIDADDIANADRLQVQYDFLEKNKDIF